MKEIYIKKMRENDFAIEYFFQDVLSENRALKRVAIRQEKELDK